MELIKNEEIIYLNDENTLIEKYDLNTLKTNTWYNK